MAWLQWVGGVCENLFPTWVTERETWSRVGVDQVVREESSLPGGLEN